MASVLGFLGATRCGVVHRGDLDVVKGKTMAARVRFYDDTLRGMALWAARKYKLRRLSIYYRSDMDAENWWGRCGLTVRHSNGAFLIELNQRRHYSTLVQTLAHELTHVITVKHDKTWGHGPKFRRNLERFIGEWNSHVAQREGGDK